MSRHRLGIAALALVIGGAATALPSIASAGARPAAPRAASIGRVKLLSCTGKPVVKPATFVISCGDGNSELTATHWTSWTSSRAVGTTRFGLNLCNPYCAASKMSYFPDSVVRLTAPTSTKHGELYSDLVVTYKLHGKTKSFSFSWRGDPSF